MQHVIQRITSAQNPLVKRLIKQREHLPLSVKKQQWQDVNILIHGEKMVDECLRLHRIKPNCLLVSNEQLLHSNENLSRLVMTESPKSHDDDLVVVVTNDSIIRSVCNVQSTNGICATFSYPHLNQMQSNSNEKNHRSLFYSDAIDETLAFQKLRSCQRTVVINKLEDPGNLGTIMRSSYSLGYDSIVILDGSISPFNEKVIKSSRTTIFSLPLITCSQESFVKWMNYAPEISCLISTCETQKSIEKHPVYRLHPASSDREPLDDLQRQKHLCVMLNHEHSGDEREFSSLLPNISYIHIPMAHSYDSMNVSQVAAILLHQFQHFQSDNCG